MLTNALSLGDRVAALTCGDRMKKALALVADGVPYRDAAGEVGYSDHREVYRWAKRAGLLETHTVQLVATYRRIADLANAELERRLVEKPEEIATRDLTVVSGVAADKIAKLKEPEPGRGAALVEALLARLHSTSALFTLEVSAGSSRAEATANYGTGTTVNGSASGKAIEIEPVTS